MKMNTCIILFFLLLLPVSQVFAQEETAETPANEESLEIILDDSAAKAAESRTEETYDNNTLFVIRGLKFDIDGISRSYALINQGEFKEGERIMGKTNLDRYIARKQQLLLNQRTLEEVSIEYSCGEKEEDGAIPVKLLVFIKDSKNFIVLPYPKYDSNEGFSLTLKIRDYNFFGTMGELAIDFGYLRNTESQNVVNFSIDTNIPFNALGLNWNAIFDNRIVYTGGEPLYYQNVTGLSVDLPWRSTMFTVGFNHYLTINEKVSDDTKDLYAVIEDFYDPYGTSEFYASWRIPLGVEVWDFGELAYTPKISTKINYPYSGLDEPRKPVTTFGHTLGFGRLDWIGNYRKELSAYFTNSYSVFIDRSDGPFLAAIDTGATIHWPFNKYTAISSRIKYRQWWQWSSRNSDWIPYYYAGDLLRGVIDEDLRADLMLSLNLEFSVKFLRLWPSEWFNKPKLHILDLEFYASPFLDLALLRGPYNMLKENYLDGTRFKLSDLVSTTGLEVIVYSGYFRSLKIRGSIGYNLNQARERGIPLKWGFFPQWDEIYVGLDLYY